MSRSAAIDVERARLETPGCTDPRRAHFNAAGAALMPAPVLAAMKAHLDLEAEIGGYEAAVRAAEPLEATYRCVATLIGAEREEIALFDNATRAWDMAFYGVPLQPGDRVLTSAAEYSGNYAAMLHRAARTGARIEALPDDADGTLSLDALRHALDSGGPVRLIAVTHVPTNNGLVSPAAQVGRIARSAGVPYLLDACQSVGQMPVDVREIGCDMLAATSRKWLRGPRGAGFLYVRRDVAAALDPVVIDHTATARLEAVGYTLYDDARRFETWEASAAARLGFGAAVDYALAWGMEAIRDRVVALAARIRSGLARVRGVQVLDRGAEQCGIVTFTVDSRAAEEVRATLARHGIAVYPRPAGPLDIAAGRPDDVLRASVHYYNTEAEVDRLCEAVGDVTS